MAVNTMKLHRNTTAFLTKVELNSVQEAAAAGLQSLHNLITLLSQSQTNTMSSPTDYTAFADVTVTNFKRFISLLDRNRSGHARFRHGLSNSNPPHKTTPAVIKQQSPSPEKVYSPAPIQQLMPPVFLPITTINFSGDTGSLQQSMSSGFQITDMSQASSAGQSNFSSSSFKRKCNSGYDSHAGCAGGTSGRCRCSKKRKSRVRRLVRVPAISMKMADIPPDDYSWRKYG